MNAPTKPSVLFVYYTHTQQSLRVADAMADVLRQRRCDVSLAGIELTDPRYGPQVRQLPLQVCVPRSPRGAAGADAPVDRADPHP
jgi:hypothetical protein